MLRLLVLLCLSIYSTLVIFGNGPPRTARYAEVPASTAPASSGIRVLPAPTYQTVAHPAPAKAAPPTRVVLASYTAPVAAMPAAAVAGNQPAALDANLHLRWITATTANIRTRPTKRSALSGKIGLGEAVHVMWAEPNGWIRIRAANGAVTGFVHKSLLTDAAPATTSAGQATAPRAAE